MIINDNFEEKLYRYIINLLEKELSCQVRIINGTNNHVHILFLLNSNLALKDVIHRVKGSSSYWINQNNFIKTKFVWQIGYGGFSVSISKLKVVEQYIKNQKEHHKKISITEEFETFLKNHGVVLAKNG